MKKKFIAFLFAIILCLFLTVTAFAYQGPAFVATNSLNVYSHGGSNSKVIDNLPRWTNVNIIEDAGYGWYKISYNEKSGYVAGYYLLFGVSEQQPETEQPKTQQPTTPTQKSNVTGDSVRLRRGPSLNSEIIEELSQGTALTVRGVCGEWYEVSYNGIIGYMYGSYINNQDITDKAAAPQSTTSTGQKIVDTARKYIGVPYVWGGESLAEGGFDCSGLVYTVYAENGIKVHRIAQSMYTDGNIVDLNNLQAGDILLFGDSIYNVWHVGIYAGDNMIIHSPGGSVVKTENLNNIYGMRLIGARRVV